MDFERFDCDLFDFATSFDRPFEPKKTQNIHWFFNGFLMFTLRAKIAHFEPFGLPGGLRLDLLSLTRADFQKS